MRGRVGEWRRWHLDYALSPVSEIARYASPATMRIVRPLACRCQRPSPFERWWKSRRRVSARRRGDYRLLPDALLVAIATTLFAARRLSR